MSWECTFFCFHRFGHAGLAFDLRTGWDLNDPAQRAKLWSHLQHERPILMVGSWSGHSAGTSHMRWMMGTYLWQVAQGRFFAHQHSGNVPRNADNYAIMRRYKSSFARNARTDEFYE